MVDSEVFSRATAAMSSKKDVGVTYTELDDFDSVNGQPAHAVTSPVVQAWPTQPKPLVLEQKERVIWTVFDVALIALPVLLLVKTGLCIYAHHLDSNNTGIWLDYASTLSQGLVQLNSQLVTLFTIVFITIMSTFVKRYALWKAQHGASIADLEQFQGSVSLPSTLKLIWSLRSFGINSVVLALAWSFYYLGSQAVKLEYRLSLSADYSNMNAAVQRSDGPSFFSPNLGDIMEQNAYSTGFSSQEYLDRLNTNFGATVLVQLDSQTVHGSPTPANPGTNNGPIIPDYDTAETMIPQTSLTDRWWYAHGGWIDVSKQQQNSYVSLVGLNLWVDAPYLQDGKVQYNPEDVPFLGTYTLYNISYLNVNCSDPIIHPEWSFPIGTLSTSSVSFNMTGPNSNAMVDRNGYPQREFDYWYRGFAIDPVPGLDSTAALPGDFNATLDYTFRAFQTTCSLNTNYVDMKVSCITTGCYPSLLRWANNTNALEATGYSTPFDDSEFAANFFSNFTLATGNQPDMNFSTIVDQAFFPDAMMDKTYWSTLGPAQMARFSPGGYPESYRLQMGFNTYYTLSQAVISDYTQPNIAGLVFNSEHKDGLFTLVHAHGAPLDQGYRIYWQWIPIDFMACTILLAAAIGAYWLRINTLAPDIFGYVSSLTRDNPHIHLPTEGSALSGIERARMLKGIKVRIADVETGANGESSVGRVGLVPYDANARPLHSNARYV